MRKSDTVRERITNLSNDLDTLINAQKLLERVYLEIGPYKRDQVSDRTWDEVRNYFEFDDSE
jgi:hypothetical protein